MRLRRETIFDEMEPVMVDVMAALHDAGHHEVHAIIFDKELLLEGHVADYSTKRELEDILTKLGVHAEIRVRIIPTDVSSLQGRETLVIPNRIETIKPA